MEKLWLRVLGLAKTEKKYLTIGFVFLLISSAASLVYPQFIRGIVDQALTQKDMARITHVSILIWVVFCIQGAASSLRYYFFTLSGERIVMRLRNKLFSHVLDQDVAFFDTHRTGDLMSRLSTDATVLQNAVSVNISMAIRNLVGGLGGLIMMILTSPKLALSMLLIIPPIGYGVARFGKRIRKFSEQSQISLGEASNVSEETFSGLRTVRSFAQEEFEKKRYLEATDRSLDTARKRILQIALFMTVAFFIGFTAVSIVIWYGGSLVVQSQLTIGELTQFIIYLMLTSISVGALGGLWGDLMAAVGAAKRVFEILDTPPKVINSSGKTLPNLKGKINFKDVTFSYPSRTDVEVLKNISFAIEPDTTTALVGISGSGKSSIVSLIMRFYDCQKGVVSIDDTDITLLEPNWLRRQIGFVSQEPILISTSIRENILYGNQTATNEQVLQAAREANADLFIRNFPEGYETLVGERGIQLSGGQKQRIAIARAILKDPRILILDEATSALDTESEALVQEALHKLMQGRTTIVIAHRLATIKDADLILVMQNGAIQEKGTHQELLNSPAAIYSKLIERQI
jgi:ABC transporter fused permease/ATP-binding protein